MRQICGPKLVVDAPTPTELDWIFESLQDSRLYLPLSLARGPTREEFDKGEIELIEGEGRGRENVNYFVARHRGSGEPWGFYLEYGWEGAFDTTREFDLAVPVAKQGSLRLLLEAHVVGSQFVFANKLAKRIRWRVHAPKDAPPRWYKRIGARHIGEMTEPHPVTGELLSKHVYELSHRELIDLFERRGFDLDVDLGKQSQSLWKLFS